MSQVGARPAVAALCTLHLLPRLTLPPPPVNPLVLHKLCTHMVIMINHDDGVGCGDDDDNDHTNMRCHNSTPSVNPLVHPQSDHDNDDDDGVGCGGDYDMIFGRPGM